MAWGNEGKMSVLAPALRFARRAENEDGWVAFLALVALAGGTLVFARDFSHLSIGTPGLPIYVTEAFLALWACTRVWRIRRLVDRVPRAFALSMAVYVTVGGITFLLSLRNGATSLDIIHDAAIFYYALFAVVVVDLVASPVRAQILMRIAALSALPLAVIGFSNLAFRTDLEITTSGTMRALSGAQGLFALLSLLASLSGLALKWEPRAVYVATLIAALLAIPLAQSRTLSLAFVIAIPLSVLIMYRHRPIFGATIGALLISVLFLLPSLYEVTGIASGYGSREGGLAENATAAIAQIALPLASAPSTAPSTAPVATVEGNGGGAPTNATSRKAPAPDSGQSQTDPNIAWRLNAWGVAFSYFAAHPLTGVGFGELHLLPRVVAQPNVPVPPHNSLITIGFESGLLGIGAFGFVLLTFYAACFSILRRANSVQRAATVSFAVGGQVAGMVILLFNVALEVPYIAMFFWLPIGLVAALATWQEERTA
jgi:O-antigen ligase